MIGKYNENPIHVLHNALFETLKLVIYYDHNIDESNGLFTKIDNILKLVLLNNGCRLAEYKQQYQRIYNIIPDEYSVIFISGMLGNGNSSAYDFVMFNGMKYLIVFVDYFDILKKDDYAIYADDPASNLRKQMGNSVYYDALKKIVEVFYLTIEPTSSILATTAMCTTQRWNQVIIAIHILNYFKPIDENDVEDISMVDVKKILKGKLALQLYGIRTV